MPLIQNTVRGLDDRHAFGALRMYYRVVDSEQYTFWSVSCCILAYVGSEGAEYLHSVKNWGAIEITLSGIARSHTTLRMQVHLL